MKWTISILAVLLGMMEPAWAVKYVGVPPELVPERDRLERQLASQQSQKTPVDEQIKDFWKQAIKLSEDLKNAPDAASRDVLQAAYMACLRMIGELEARRKAIEADIAVTNAAISAIYTKGAPVNPPGSGHKPPLKPGDKPGVNRALPGGATSPPSTASSSSTPTTTPARAGKLKVPAGLPGLTQDEASARITAAGFTSFAIVGANTQTPDGKGGTVEQHVPAAGTEHDASTTVTLYVYPRPDEAIVPGVRGLKVAEAKLQIEGVKLKTALQVSADLPPDAAREYTVQAQSYPKGVKLKIGEVVTLTIYPKFGEPPANTVPDVVGRTTDVALGIIRGKDLQIRGMETLALPKDKQDKADTVLRQTPAAGQPIPADKLVSIVVYAPRARAGSDDAGDLRMDAAAARDSEKLVGTYRGTFQLVQSGGQQYQNADATAKEAVVSIRKTGNDWTVYVDPAEGGNLHFGILETSRGLVVRGQSLRQETKSGSHHWVWKIVLENGQLTGTAYKEDLSYRKAGNPPSFGRYTLHAYR